MNAISSGAEHEVDRHQNHAEPGGGEGEHDVLPAVVAQQRQPVSLGQAPAGQGVRGPVDGRVELGVADPQVAGHDGELVRIPGRAAVQQVPDRMLPGTGDDRSGSRAEHRIHERPGLSTGGTGQQSPGTRASALVCRHRNSTRHPPVRLAADGQILVVRGEAGIGKSALLAAAAGLAADSGARLLSATGVQAEARLPFAGLHQLLRPVLPLAERLPPRQRAALLSAFGMADAEPAGPFLIGLATLEVISDAAASSPLLLIADDAQWLDEPSCAVLGFVARRLTAEPAALLVCGQGRAGQPVRQRRAARATAGGTDRAGRGGAA